MVAYTMSLLQTAYYALGMSAAWDAGSVASVGHSCRQYFAYVLAMDLSLQLSHLAMANKALDGLVSY